MSLCCRDLVGFLTDYLDDALPPEERAEFERHLHGCPPCLVYLETFRETVRLGREVCRVDDEVPDDVPEALVQAILSARSRGRGGAGGGPER